MSFYENKINATLSVIIDFFFVSFKNANKKQTSKTLLRQSKVNLTLVRKEYIVFIYICNMYVTCMQYTLYYWARMNSLDNENCTAKEENKYSDE